MRNVSVVLVVLLFVASCATETADPVNGTWSGLEKVDSVFV